MEIQRALLDRIMTAINTNKVLLLFGTRRVGKTHLLHQIIQRIQRPYLFMHGEDMEVQSLLSRRTAAHYSTVIGNHTLLIIDEAQAIPQIGQILKLMIDINPQLTILATGSSALDLLNQSGEPLTGRSQSYHLYPIAISELQLDLLSARKQLEERLILGSYPELFHMNNWNEKANYLKELIQSYLLKDILSFSGIKHADKIYSLLKLVAYQVGSEVSYNELSRNLGINKVTVENYLDLLTKVFILFKLPSYSTNPRKEISKSAKWYFYDNGIRNAIINDFRPIHMRNDIGQLWESYFIAERIKHQSYLSTRAQHYFWRNYHQQEVDLIEVFDGSINAFEIKYNENKKAKSPPSFQSGYPQAQFNVVNPDNFMEYLTLQ